MNNFLTKGSDLLLTISYAHAHEEAIVNCSLLALLEFVLIWIELVDHAHVLKLGCFLVVGLATHNQDMVSVPRQVNCNNVGTIRELLIGRKFNGIPLISDD